MDEMRKQMRMATCLTSVCMTLLGTITLAQSVTYNYDRAASFSNYKTYAWTGGTELTDELNHARVVRAIDAVLVAKGLARVEPNAHPDVVVAYHASFEKNLEINGPLPWVGSARPGRRSVGVARVQPVLVGTLVVDISDARTRAIVWRSLASSDISPTDKPESRDKKIARATEKMFKNYPPKPSRPSENGWPIRGPAISGRAHERKDVRSPLDVDLSALAELRRLVVHPLLRHLPHLLGHSMLQNFGPHIEQKCATLDPSAGNVSSWIRARRNRIHRQVELVLPAEFEARLR